MVGGRRRGIAPVFLGALLASCALPSRPTLREDDGEASSPMHEGGPDASLDVVDAGVERDAADARDVSAPAPDGEAGAVDGPDDRSLDADSGAVPDAKPTDGSDAGDAGSDAPFESASPDGTGPCVVSISAGMWHTCGLLRDGVHCWGHDGEGELGDGLDPSDSRPGVSPTPVLENVKAVSAGAMHSCALTTAGGVRCWGFNNAGQLGFAQPDAAVPLLSPPSTDVLTNVKAIAAGYDFTCALTVSGGVRCWGSNAYGQLGIGSSSITMLSTPPSADAITGVKAVAAGDWHTCVLTTAGGVRCWGQNTNGQLGIGSLTPEDVFAPPATDVLTGASAVAAGYAHTCAVMISGGVRCWGFNMYGQLGDGTTNDRLAPPTTTTALAGVPVASVGAGYAHTCALTAAGSVYCWGYNLVGQIAEDTSVVPQEVAPALIPLGTQATALTVGDSYSCAITVGGSVLCWGTDNNGQFGDGAIAGTRFTPTLASSLEAVCRM